MEATCKKVRGRARGYEEGARRESELKAFVKSEEQSEEGGVCVSLCERVELRRGGGEEKIVFLIECLCL